MASEDNRVRSNRKIDEFFTPTALGTSHVGNNSNPKSTAVSNEVEMRDVAEEIDAEVTEGTNVPLDSTQLQSNAPILYLPSICSTKAYKQKMPRNAPRDSLPAQVVERCAAQS